MRKIALLLILSICFTSAYSQKKKAAKKPAATAAFAKLDNLTVELIKSNLYLCINNKGAAKDTLLLRKYTDKANPMNCKITKYTTKGTELCLVTWSDNTVTQTTDKTEDKTETYSEVWNLATKNKPLANIQTVTKIKQILWLDAGKNASQTSEKLRNEGFVFSMTPDGDITLKNKTQENKLTYNTQSNIYENVKTPAASAKPKKK